MEEDYIIGDNEDKCQDCSFYIMIDSGYGYCRRFPPAIRNMGSWWKPKRELKYQLTEWCRKACGEFRK